LFAAHLQSRDVALHGPQAHPPWATPRFGGTAHGVTMLLPPQPTPSSLALAILATATCFCSLRAPPRRLLLHLAAP